MARSATYNIESKDNTKKGLKSAQKNIKGFGDKVKSTTGMMKTAFAGIGITAATTAMLKFGKAAVSAWGEQEDAVRQLTNSVNNNPLMTGDAVYNLEQFAGELQKSTTIGDEAAIKLANLAVAAGANADETRKMTSAAIDVSAAMGISMDSAMKSIIKQMSGMTGELGEVVPELRNLTKEQLQAGEGIDLLAEKFKGAGAAMADTTQGGLTQFKNAFGDLMEQFGRGASGPMSAVVGKLAELTSGYADYLRQRRDEADVQNQIKEGGGIDTSTAELEEQRAAIQERINGYEEEIRRGVDIYGVLQGQIAEEEKKIARIDRVLRGKRIEEKYNNAAVDAAEDLAAHNEKIAERQSAFEASQKRINELVDARKDPLQRQIEGLNERISKLSEYRKVMKANGKWERKYQEIINGLIKQRTLLQGELKEKNEENNDTGDEETNKAKELGEYQQKKLDLEKKIYALRMKINSAGSDAEKQYYNKQLNQSKSEYDDLTKTGGGGEQAPTGMAAAMGKLKGIASGFGNAFGGIMNAIKAPGQALSGIFGDLISGVLPMIMSLSKVVKLMNPLQTILSAMMQILGPAINKILNPLVGILNIIGQVLAMMIIPILDLLTPTLELITTAFIWTYNYGIRPFANAMIWAFNMINNMVAYIWNAIASAINSILGWAGVHVSKMAMKSATEGFLDEISKKDLEDAGEGEQVVRDDYGASDEAGGGDNEATYEKQRDIKVNIYFPEETYLVGEGGMEEFTLYVTREIERLKSLSIA